MKSKQKFITLITILILFTFVISACSPSRDNGISIRTNDLSLDVAGSGLILDTNENRIITNLPRTLEIDEDSIINLSALDYNEDFLFWVGDHAGLESEREQRILMDEDKELIAVFEDPEVLYMAGNIKHAWGHDNVIGYWKAIIGHDELAFEDGTLDLYVRETIGRERNYIRVFDEDDELYGDFGRIAYEGPQTADVSPAEFEYIAAILRVEESIDNEVFLLVYAEYDDQQQIEIVILPDTYIELYNETLKVYDDHKDDEDYTKFREKVRLEIENHKDNEDVNYLLGDTIEVNNPFETR